jgi:PEP-CTERM motif
MFRKALLTTAAAIAMFALSSVARADTITLTGINGTGVTATISNFSLSGNTFTFTINNTSVAPNTTGVITNIGFALPGNRPNNYTLVSSSNPNYFLAYDLNATAGSQNFVSSFDLVLMDKTNGNPTFGGGSVNNGIQPGTSATFSISGDFSGLTASQIAHDIFARFQNVNPGGSDVAMSGPPTNPNPVPEPMTMLLFGTGLAGVAARARRRRNVKA